MRTKLIQALALLSTGLLAGVFYYGTFTVVPAFYEVPIEIHLKYRVALMNHNAVYVQLLTIIAIVMPAWYALISKHARLIVIYAVGSAIAALISILTTRFGNVPINHLITEWEATGAPKNWREILDQWNIYNDIRTMFALASFILILIASQINTTEIKNKILHQ